MKRTLIALLAGALMVASGACNQDETGESSSQSAVKGQRGPHGKRGMRNPAMRAGRLQKRLGLSDEQTAKLETALKDGLSREDQMKVLEEILTPEQLTQYKEMMTGRGRGGPRGFRDPAAHANMLKEALGLSDEQTAKVQQVFEEKGDRDTTQKALEAILTPEQLTKYEEWKATRGPRGMHGHGGKRGFRSPEKHAAWLQEELGLTDEVKAKLEAIFKDQTSREEKHEALKTILGPEDYAQFEEMTANRGRWHHKPAFKAGFRAPEKHIAWLKEELQLSDEQATQLEAAFKNSKSREDVQKALKEILTPEQLQQHDEMMMERRAKGGMHGGPHHGKGDMRGPRGKGPAPAEPQPAE